LETWVPFGFILCALSDDVGNVLTLEFVCEFAAFENNKDAQFLGAGFVSEVVAFVCISSLSVCS
jgi:hypothetical protein